MTALLLFDALDAAAAIWRALLVWIVVGAATARLLLLGTLAGLAWVGRRVWQAVTRRQAGACGPHGLPRDSKGAETAPEPADGRTAPLWALTQPLKEN